MHERIKPVSFPEEEITYLTPSWDDMNKLAFDISRAMLEDGRQFDRVVTLARGGWPMAVPVVDFLGVPNVASIGVKFYSGIGEHMAKPEIYQELPVRVAGEKILLFDDVADTGESLEFAGRHLEEFGASEITTATIFYKPHSKLEPDYYGSQTDAWIIFPCEVRETIEALSEKWQKAGVSPDEIKNRFLALNFREEWVDFYFKA